MDEKNISPNRLKVLKDNAIKPNSIKAMAERPLCVRLDVELDSIIRSLPDTSAWLRKVIAEAAEEEGLIICENDASNANEKRV